MVALARDEIDALTRRTETLVDEIKLLLLPRDPLDDKNIMLEVRSLTAVRLCTVWHCHLEAYIVFRLTFPYLLSNDRSFFRASYYIMHHLEEVPGGAVLNAI